MYFVGIDVGLKNNGIVIINKQQEIIYSTCCSLEEINKEMFKIITDFKVFAFCLEQPILYKNVPPSVTLQVAYWFGEVLGIIRANYLNILKKEPSFLTQPQSIIARRLGAKGKKEEEMRESIGKIYNVKGYDKLNAHEKDALACSLFLLLGSQDRINILGNKAI